MTKRPDGERDLGRPNKTAHNDKPAPRSTATNHHVEWTSATFVSTGGTSAYQPVSTDDYSMPSTVTESDKDRTTITKEDTQIARDKNTESVTEVETNTVTEGETNTVTEGETNAVTENFKEYTVMMSSSDEIEYMSRVLVVFCFQMGLELVIAACD